jgi:cell pole-organizing protein PopZ
MSGQHEPNHPDEFASLAADMPAAVPDPSMEDILASIRRILNEEEAKPQADAADEPDVLELDHTMMLPDEDQPGHNQPAAVPESPPALVRPAADPVASVMAVPMPPPIAAPVRPMPTLVAPEAAAATAVSVGELMQTLATQRSTAVHRGGPTIEDLVREEIRPLLKEWLDTHLPPLVERLVRAEIERVVSRMS